MARAYLGVDLSGIKDGRARRALSELNLALRDISRGLTQAGGGAGGPAASEVITKGAFDVGVSLVAQSYITIATDNTLLNERTIAATAPVVFTDGGAKSTATISFDSTLMTTAVPAFVFGTTNVIGTGAPVAANATLAIFDTSTGADLVSAASNGVLAFAARADHAHRFPTSLMEYTNSKTLALTSTATVSTLTTGSGITGLVIAGATTIRAAATNTLNFGTSGNRILSGWFGTTGINCSGPVTLGGNLTTAATTLITLFSGTRTTGDIISNADAVDSLGNATNRFVSMYGGTLLLYDQQAGVPGAFNVEMIATSTPALTANRLLTLDMTNAARTITLTGNATLNQDVSTAGSPEFVDLNLNDTGSAFRTALRSTSSGVLTADRVLTLDVANAARTLRMTGNATVNQDVSTAGSPSFGGLTAPNPNFSGTITLADSANIVTNATTGTKIGTATTQKVGFWNVTPVVQPSDFGVLTNDTGGTADGTVDAVGIVYSQTEINNNFAEVAVRITQIRNLLRSTGLMA